MTTAARAVACRICGATQGEPCRSLLFDTPVTYYHGTRVREARDVPEADRARVGVLAVPEAFDRRGS